jgi:hypothetical protein
MAGQFFLSLAIAIIAAMFLAAGPRPPGPRVMV